MIIYSVLLSTQCFKQNRGVLMKRALSYMMIGALTSSAMWLFFQNREDITRQFNRAMKENKRFFNKFKAMF